MNNAFTIDLEDWFCSHNLLSAVRFEEWERLESRVERNTYLLLNLLSRKKTKATFFVLGWIAEHFEQLIRDIAAEGHELASHGYAHKQIILMESGEFETDIRKSIGIMKSITGIPPLGYRAPAFSITQKTLWALTILKKLGFQYDSSVYPFSAHPDYGDAQSPLSIHTTPENIVEVPLSCATYSGRRIPCSGGAYFRFYPYTVFRALAKNVIKSNRPFIFYIHPWELDADPPKVPLPYSKSIRHYYNSGSTPKKIERLLEDFEFTTIQTVLTKQTDGMLYNATGIQHTDPVAIPEM